MPTSSAEVYLTQAPEGSIPLPSTSSVIVPTGPQIIQVPIVTSPVVPHPPPSCSLIILQPQLPIISTMQQQPAMLPTNAMYLPSTNGMVHLNYASQLPTTLHHPQFPTILPNTFICTQDTSSGVAMPSHPQAFPVNFSWRKKVRENTEKRFSLSKNFFFLFRLESNCFAATAKENMLCYMRCILGDYLLNKSFYECSFLFCQQRKPWKNRHRSQGFHSGNEIRRDEGNEESSGIGYLRCFLVFPKNVCTKLVTTNGNTNLDLVLL